MRNIFKIINDKFSLNSNYDYVKSKLKIRLRGKGSGYLEGEHKLESNDELQLAVSSIDCDIYYEVKSIVISMLNNIYYEYHNFIKGNRNYKYKYLGEIRYKDVKYNEFSIPT